jgi:hypothetical protein
MFSLFFFISILVFGFNIIFLFKYSFLLNNQGVPNTPLPIITASQSDIFIFSSASTKSFTSPFKIINGNFNLFSLQYSFIKETTFFEISQ